MDFDSKREGSGTKEWAEVTENICRGCANNCLYCYAAHNANRFKQRDRADWGREELTTRANITTYPARNGVVMFPSTHDITPFNVDAFIRFATLILQKGNRLLIVSKPRRDCINKVMDALEPWKSKILFRFTIGAIDDALISLWEPGAPSSIERLDTLADTELRDFPRSISIEPMLGGVEETKKVVFNVLPWNPETIWIGKMNKVNLRVTDKSPEVVKAMAEIARLQSDGEILRLYRELEKIKVLRWKDSIQTVLVKTKEPK